MINKLDQISQLAKSCRCGYPHNEITIEQIVVGDRALKQSTDYLKAKGFRQAVLIGDERTMDAAGKKLANLLEEMDINYSLTLIQPDENDDVVVNEASIVQAMIETPNQADILIAVGSGTIHDIVRFCSYKMKIPFISIPTAPSVDGFTSMGAPLIVKGEKKTFQTISPIAVFADIGILMDAPREMIAAGFGDMLAKYTSLADWKFSHLAGGEPYCPLVEQITRDALELCVANVDKIAEGKEEGIPILIETLILSGVAMLIFGHSHSASGGEHHLSHYWEMEFLREKRPQVLHGAKVGVSMPLLLNLYKTTFFKILDDPAELKKITDPALRKRIEEHKEIFQAVLKEIPDSSVLRSMIEKVGGLSRPEQLGISESLVNRGLENAHLVRDRFTILKFLNEEIKVNYRLADIQH